jgi:hypothetical protein
MAQRCEVCERFRPGGDLQPGRELTEASFRERRVLLCRAHASIAKNLGATSLDELRKLFGESTGQRSFVSRRGRYAWASGKPRRAGRRATDSAT